MPYIKQESRERLDSLTDDVIDAVVSEVEKSDDETNFLGTLNYVFTRITLGVIWKLFGGVRYWILESTRGMLKGVGDEMHRRLQAPYEDEKIEENGDVDYYELHLDKIKHNNN